MTKEARIFNGTRTVLSISDIGKTGHPHTKTKLDHYVTLHTKKLIQKALKNLRPEVIGLKENVKLPDLCLSRDCWCFFCFFLYLIPKAKAAKAKLSGTTSK